MKDQILDQYHLHEEDPGARQFELFDLNAYLSKNRKHSCVPHSHSFYQLICFDSNKGSHHVDFSAHPVKANRVFLIAKNQVHYFEPGVEYHGVLMHFNESFLLRDTKDMELFIQYGLFNSSTPYVKLNSHAKKSINAIRYEIERELTHGSDFGHRLVLSNLLRSMLVLMERLKRQESELSFDTNQHLVWLEFRAVLEQNFKSPKNISAYAADLNVSTKTLNSYCKVETGQTALELITQRKILEAKRLLLHSEAQVNEIAFSLGFEDPSYFVKLFKKHVELTPKQFRDSISR